MSTTASSARWPALCAAVAIASVGLATAGCSAASHAAASSTATAATTVSAPPVQALPTAATPGPAVSAVATPTTAAPTTGAAPASPAPASPAGGVPTLGRPAGVFAQGVGFGQVKPPKIFNGGDPTGLVTHVVWKSWGGARAVATGTSDYVGPNQSVAGGTEEPATVVAFNLGTCDGKLVYRAVEWYFPRHHQAFDPHRYEDVCTGAYVPGT